jgi:hypothetical protein
MMPGEDLPLRDIHLPDPVSWWPPAPGWWLLLAAAALILASIVLLVFLRKRRRLKRSVKAELVALRQHYQQQHDRLQLVQSLSALMRRACISFYPRQNAAGLTGDRWLQYLDSTAQRKEFEHGTGRILATAPYLPTSSKIDTDLDELLALCEDWLKTQPYPASLTRRHRVPIRHWPG